MALDRREQAAILQRGIRNLDTRSEDLPQAEVEAAWCDELRKRIAPTRISTANWIHVIESAHELGIPTTSTMMFGHVETAEQRMRRPHRAQQRLIRGGEPRVRVDRRAAAMVLVVGQGQRDVGGP